MYVSFVGAIFSLFLYFIFLGFVACIFFLHPLHTTMMMATHDLVTESAIDYGHSWGE